MLLVFGRQADTREASYLVLMVLLAKCCLAAADGSIYLHLKNSIAIP